MGVDYPSNGAFIERFEHNQVRKPPKNNQKFTQITENQSKRSKKEETES
ncbi:unnamed protein product [Cuscuta europaea]|uniref:Uncharacterized protein n=1 Tax=Cuscuta europaea TaxID=41803 RepID=A0A9P1EMV8_CUSEU|nr:unnamed protein product [Cuscuta europaea]